MAPGLLRAHPVFRSVLAARAVSALGDRFSLVAVPVLALSSAGATPGQVALLWTVQLLPGAVLALPAAANLVGRPERAAMIACDLLRAVLLLGVFGLAAGGELRLWHLFAVVPAIGVLTTVFDVGAQAYVPRIVDRADYAEANSRFTQAESAADVAGPLVAGVLIGFAGAGTALLVDAVSFVLSAVLLAPIRAVHDQPVEVAASGWWRNLRDGIRFVAGSPVLRSLVAAFALFNFGGAVVSSLWFAYLLDHLRLPPSVTGGLITVGGVSGLVAALATRRVLGVVSSRVVLPVSLVVIVVSLWFVPLAALGSPVLLLAAYQALFGAGVAFFAVTAATVRQLLTPVGQQGRVYAVFYTFSLLTVPIGGLLAGVLASSFSPVVAIVAGAAIAATSLLTLVSYRSGNVDLADRHPDLL
ncbi:MFS transporter [Amycolatopsis sp. YIM 10]|uniref:MFS transporter n=1 Tax=Amycolatopsis sp. YIM 10 TaxID=2653857 RepID=UPI0012A94606|nr:MFS transporter [Amycolatopsis sp. YIM 10]QFU88543.1 enterobactin exporter EntS [Amycolatopsis sp. YIM 10]